ncbi:MAG TPA: efflux RND transporter periplasmic adaptor subunit [Crinalium sp.]|jgi:RND family efflux transporter MFP subunit
MGSIDKSSERARQAGIAELERSPIAEPTVPSDYPARRTGPKWGTLLLGMGLGVALTAGGLAIGSRRGEQQPVAPSPMAQVAGQSVTVVPVAMTQVSRTLEATGGVAARDLLPVLPQANGLQVQRVLVDEGQSVQAGQILAELDNSVLQAQLRQARAQAASAQATVSERQAALQQERATLAEAQSNLGRYQQLFNEGATSAQELEARRTAVATAQATVGSAQAAVSSAQAEVQSNVAQIQQLQTQLGQTVVRAPASGIIAESLAKVGDVTSSSNKLFSIIQNGRLELEVKVPATELSQVRIGAPVRVTSDSDRRINLQGTVREIDPLVDPQTRQATVRVNLPNTSLLRPGVFLRAALTIATAQAMTVPADAVLPQPDGSSIVYVLQNDSTVRAQTVEVGVRQTTPDQNAARVEIRQGLNVGDRVVVAGAGYVRDGDRVQVVSGS